MQQYIDKKELCNRLNLSPRTIQKEVEKALLQGQGGVIKIGCSYRINYNEFIQYITNRNKNNEEVKEWERKELRILAKGTMSTILTTTRKERGSELQLKQLLGI